MMESWRRRRRAARRLGRALNELEALFPTKIPAETPVERSDLLMHVGVLDVLMTGAYSLGWPPGSSADVRSEVGEIPRGFARA